MSARLAGFVGSSRGFLGVLLLCGYAVPLFFPPAATHQPWPSLDAPLLDRLFPGVPGWWIAGRLCALPAGAWLISGIVPTPERPLRPTVSTLTGPLPSAANAIALCLAALHFAFAFYARSFDRLGQAAFVGAAFLPGFIVSLSALDPAAVRRKLEIVLPIAAPLAVIVPAWIAWRLWATWGSPIVASPWDIWFEYDYMRDVIENRQNALFTQHLVGLSDLRMFFAGMDPFGSTEMPSLRTMQSIGVGWAIWAAAASAWTAYRIISPRSAVWAAVTVLAAPMTSALTHWAWPVFTWHTAITATEMALLAEVWRTGSPGALLWLAGTASLIATQAIIGFWIIPAGFYVLWLAVRRRDLPLTTMATGALTFVALAIPYLQSLNTDEMEVYTPFAVWTYSEDLSQEQIGFLPKPEVLELRPSSFDYALGGALAPFAVPRTVLRAWGDALLDPLTATLVAIGLCLCVRLAWRGDPRGWWLLAALIVHLPVMLTSCYDRVSPFRNLGMPAAASVFAALAVEALAIRQRWNASQIAAGAAGCLIAGGAYYQIVTPLVIGAGALEIVLETAKSEPPGTIALLKLAGSDVTFARLAVDAIGGDTTISLRDYSDRSSLLDRGEAGKAIAPVIAWAPALEMDCDVARALCAEWPEALLYTVWSKSKLSRVYFAVPNPGNPWQPTLAVDRWSKSSCRDFGDPFPEDGLWIHCSPDRRAPDNIAGPSDGAANKAKERESE